MKVLSLWAGIDLERANGEKGPWKGILAQVEPRSVTLSLIPRLHISLSSYLYNNAVLSRFNLPSEFSLRIYLFPLSLI